MNEEVFSCFHSDIMNKYIFPVPQKISTCKFSVTYFSGKATSLCIPLSLTPSPPCGCHKWVAPKQNQETILHSRVKRSATR